jgi:transposase
MARKGKYTPQVVARLVRAVRMGSTYGLACKFAGIGERTFFTWMADAREARETGAKSKYSNLLEEIERAEGEAAVRWLAVIEKAAVDDGDWRASAWRLERRYPDEYGKRAIQFSGQVDTQMTVGDEEVVALRGLLERIGED